MTSPIDSGRVGGAGGDSMLISASSAANRLGISPRFLWSLTRAGKVPCVRIGRRVLYDPEALNRFIASRSEGGA